MKATVQCHQSSSFPLSPFRNTLSTEMTPQLVRYSVLQMKSHISLSTKLDAVTFILMPTELKDRGSQQILVELIENHRTVWIGRDL